MACRVYLSEKLFEKIQVKYKIILKRERERKRDKEGTR